MRERRITCPECGYAYRTRNPGWVCEACEPDVAAEAVPAILAAITADLRVSVHSWLVNRHIPRTLDTCPHDGCLIEPGEDCPACRARVAKRHARDRARVPTGSVRQSAGWVRKGLIYVKKKEVA